MNRRLALRRAMTTLAIAGAVAVATTGGCTAAGRPADAASPDWASPDVAGPGPGADSTAGEPSPANLADLTPYTDGLRLARPVNGVRHGELVLTIRNNGPVPVANVHFSVEVPESMSRATGDWSGCTDLVSQQVGFPAGAICEKGYLAAGGTVTFRLGMSSPAARDDADSRISRWLVDVWAGGPGDDRQPDARPEDNRRIFSVHRD